MAAVWKEQQWRSRHGVTAWKSRPIHGAAAWEKETWSSSVVKVDIAQHHGKEDIAQQHGKSRHGTAVSNK